MRKEQTKRIADAQGEDHVYVVREFGAEEGFDLAMEVAGVAGDVLGPLARLAMSNQVDQLSQAVLRLAMQLQQRGGASLLKRILKETTRDGKRLNPGVMGEGDDTTWTFNAAYRANYGEMMHAVVFALEVNFASFFAGYSPDLMKRVNSLMVPDPPSES